MSLATYMPLAGDLRHSPREWLRLDPIAGLTSAAVVIPNLRAARAGFAARAPGGTA